MDSNEAVKTKSGVLRRSLLAMALAALSLASVAQTDRIELPDMGNSADNFLSDGEEAEYARAILMQMRAYEMLVADPLIADYFSDMGFRLVAHSDRPDKSFIFVVLDEPRVNAFAAPGGVIALHSGLILAAEDEHEVAGVLAHEIAHVTQLHLYRTLQNTQRMTIPIALGMLAVILAGGGGGEAIAGALAGAQAMQMQAYINFTRANEAEADRIGITTLSLAGYDPGGMADFFERINRINRVGGEGPPEFLRTHPVTVNRIAEAKDRAAGMPAPEPTDGLDFYLMQARLRALTEEKAGDAVAWFRDRLEKPGTPGWGACWRATPTDSPTASSSWTSTSRPDAKPRPWRCSTTCTAPFPATMPSPCSMAKRCCAAATRNPPRPLPGSCASSF
jgi:predicted Zn-dependent protease